MKLFKKFLSINSVVIIAIAAIIPVLPVDSSIVRPELKVAHAAESAPTGFEVSVKDHQCTDQEGYSGVVGPSTSSSNGNSRGDSNAKDPDCGRIQLVPGNVSSTPQSDSIYTNDFRIGTKLGESTSSDPASCNPGRDNGPIEWTPWASDGGGSSWGAVAGANINDPDCLWIYYQTRAMPSNVRIQDVQAGISIGHGGMRWTPWARSGGGWSDYSGGGNLSPARVALNVSLVEMYDAEYVSDTVPATMQQNQSGNYNVVMKNKATTWLSDAQTPTVDSCENAIPASESDTCQATVEVSSTKVKLKRIDADSQIDLISPTASSPFIYRETVTKSYQAGDICVQFSAGGRGTGDGGGKDAIDAGGKDDGGFGGAAGDLFNYVPTFISVAHANRPSDGEDPDDPGPYCLEWDLGFYLTDVSPVNPNINLNENATFPLSISVDNDAANGTHTLQFQMIKIADNSQFGAVANVPVQVGAPFTLSCGVDQYVTVGTTAFYSLSATVSSGFTSALNTTMTSSPSGAIMTTSPVVLNTGNSYTAQAQISTSALAPALYTLNFSATEGIHTATCQSHLTVIGLQPVVNLYFNESVGPVLLPNGVTNGSLRWSTENVNSCTASTSPSPNTVTPAWSGNITPVASGSQAVSGLQLNTQYQFTLTCTGLGGAETKTVIVSTGAPLTPPTADLQCLGNGGQRTPSNGPCTVAWNTAGILYWTSSNAATCSFNQGIGTVPTSGSNMSTGNLSASSTTFTLTCTGPGGTVSDSVVFNLTTNASFTLNCTPLTATIIAGDTTSYALNTTSVDGFASPVTFTATIAPALSDAPTVSFINNGQVPNATTTAVVATTASTGDKTYTITFSAIGGGSSNSCQVDLQVDPAPVTEGNARLRVTASNITCGTIDLAWSGALQSDPDAFRVYRRSTPLQRWEHIGGDIGYRGNQQYTYTDDSPINPTGSNYYAIATITNGDEVEVVNASPSPIVPSSCNANISLSDKDVIQVAQGNAIRTNAAAVICSGNSEIMNLPNNAIFKPGDVVTFRINVCNSGNTPLTGVVISDTLSNLSSPGNFDSPQGCLQSAKDFGNGVIQFSLADIASGAGGTQSCSVVFTAVVTASSSGPASSLYRFQNTADITTNELSLRVYTPPYIFSVGAGVPDRNETAPQ